MNNENMTVQYNGFNMMKKDTAFSLILALLIVPFVSLTLWGGFNVGYTVSAVSFLVLFSVYLFNKNVKFKFFPYLCLFLALMSSVVFTVSADSTVRFFLFLLLTLSVFIWLVYLGGYDISDDYSLTSAVVIGIFGSAFGSIGKSMQAVFTARRQGGKGIGKIFAGVACAIPAVAILVLLLRSSDAAFDGLISKIDNYIGDSSDIMLKIIVGGLFFPIVVSLGLGLAKNKREQRKWQINGKMDSVFAASFLSAISFVYLTYIFSQFAYFFSAFKGLLPNGITHASYARRGFFEMTVIAAINFVIICLASMLTKKREDGKRNAFLNTVIVFIGAFTLLLIATAISKMVLYIDAFGMTRLRILTSAFMVFLALLFIAVILRVFIKKIPVVKTGIIAATVILLAVGFCDVDTTVAKYNLYAAEQGYTKTLDVQALGDLGYGAVPTLYEVYKNEKNPIEMRKAAKDELYEKVEEMYEITTIGGETKYERKTEVGSFNLKTYKAEKVLNEFLGK